MKILYIAHRIPYPPNKGDKIRSFNEIKYLSRKHVIHLACLADDFADLKYVDDLKRYCQKVTRVLINPKLARLKSLLYVFSKKPLSIPYFYSKKLQQIINNFLWNNNYDIIFCFSSPMAEYVFRSAFSSRLSIELGDKLSFNSHRSKKNEHSTKLIMDFVDIDSDKWRQYAEYTKFPYSRLYLLEAKRLAKFEQKIAETSSYSIFVSNKEVELFQKKNPHIKNIIALSNGIDFDYFNPDAFNNAQYTIDTNKLSTINGQPILLFIGTMDYFANIDGVKWFVKEIFPLIKNQFPDTKFYITGSKPTKEVILLGQKDGIVVTGFVPDIREYLKKATVFVAPLRIARGIQNKILEAMAMGIPVVATPQAFEGIEAKPNKDLFVEEISEAFADQVIKLVKNNSIRESLKKNARKLIEKKYSWDRNLKVLDHIISSHPIN